jgi:hypothetical protein
MSGRLLIFLFAACLLGGCKIARDQVNLHVREIDTSWIEPGITTRRQVIDRIGIPPAAKGLGGVTADTFRWTLYDRYTGTLEAGYIVTPTFELSRAHFAEDILVKFDESGKVSLVSRTVSDGKDVRITEWKEKRK